jgi:5'(3')-deoxyribonucleotidase
MVKPIIAVDIDDVLANNAAGFVAFSNQKWGTHLAVDDYEEHWARVWGIEHDLEEVTRRRDAFISSGVHRDFSPTDNAHNSLRRLSERYELHVVTSRLLTMKDDTRQWLTKHYGDVFTDTAIHYAGIWDTLTSNSHNVTKADTVNVLGADYLIDDQLKHCEAVAEAGKRALLFGNYGWNQANNLHPNITRVKNWAEVEEYFREA